MDIGDLDFLGVDETALASQMDATADTLLSQPAAIEDALLSQPDLESLAPAQSLDDSQTQEEGPRSRGAWTPAVSQALWDAALALKRSGKVPDTMSFKGQTLNRLEQLMQDSGVDVPAKKLIRQRLDYKKKTWSHWLFHLRHCSGWGRDRNGLPVTDEYTARAHFEQHPNCKPFMTRLPDDFEQMSDLFSEGNVATGRYAQLSIQQLAQEDQPHATPPPMQQGEQQQGSAADSDGIDDGEQPDIGTLRAASSSRGRSRGTASRSTRTSGSSRRSSNQRNQSSLEPYLAEFRTAIDDGKEQMRIIEFFMSERTSNSSSMRRRRAIELVRGDKWFKDLTVHQKALISALFGSKGAGVADVVLSMDDPAERREYMLLEAGIGTKRARISTSSPRKAVRSYASASPSPQTWQRDMAMHPSTPQAQQRQIGLPPDDIMQRVSPLSLRPQVQAIQESVDVFLSQKNAFEDGHGRPQAGNASTADLDAEYGQNQPVSGAETTANVPELRLEGNEESDEVSRRQQCTASIGKHSACILAACSYISAHSLASYEHPLAFGLHPCAFGLHPCASAYILPAFCSIYCPFACICAAFACIASA